MNCDLSGSGEDVDERSERTALVRRGCMRLLVAFPCGVDNPYLTNPFVTMSPTMSPEMPHTHARNPAIIAPLQFFVLSRLYQLMLICYYCVWRNSMRALTGQHKSGGSARIDKIRIATTPNNSFYQQVQSCWARDVRTLFPVRIGYLVIDRCEGIPD